MTMHECENLAPFKIVDLSHPKGRDPWFGITDSVSGDTIWQGDHRPGTKEATTIIEEYYLDPGTRTGYSTHCLKCDTGSDDPNIDLTLLDDNKRAYCMKCETTWSIIR